MTSTSARIQPVEPPYAESVSADFESIMRGAPPLGIFRTVAQNPRVLSRMIAGGLLDKGSISIRLRELMILRTCALCGAEYEWAVHIAVYAAKAALTNKEIASITSTDSESISWAMPEQLVLRLADTLHRSSNVDDELWAALAIVFDSAQLIELLMLAGLYHAVSYVVNAARVAPEPFALRFPSIEAGN